MATVDRLHPPSGRPTLAEAVAAFCAVRREELDMPLRGLRLGRPRR